MVEGAKSSLVIPYTYDGSITEMNEEERSFYLFSQLDTLFEDYFNRCKDCSVLVEPMDQVSAIAWQPYFMANSRMLDVSQVGVENYLRNNEQFLSNGLTEMIIVHLPFDAPLSDYDAKITNVINQISQKTRDYIAVLSSDDMYLPTQSSMSLRHSPVKYEWAERSIRDDQLDDDTPSPAPPSPSGEQYQYADRWPEYVWEMLLCFFLLVIIFFYGICCLCGLDTPQRFDNPKEKTL
jgi:hypothetical protein